MENNIFFKINNNKYNPDIINKPDINQSDINNKYNPDINNKFSQKESERSNNNFNLLNTIYNPITGIIPESIKSPDDLRINNDINIYNINKLISEKEIERKQQEQLFNNTINNNNILQTKVINNYNQNSCSDNFNELKEKSLTNNKKSENNNFNNIITELKDLGILN
jgi:hypothetical protein